MSFKIKNPEFCKRFLLSLTLGLLFWLICVYVASFSDANVSDYSKAIFWLIVTNRILVWFFIAIIWIYTEHPIFGFKFPPYLRWAMIWIIVSTQLAIWYLLTTAWTWKVFVWVLVIWWIYWAIIDMITTKLYWDWKKLFK